MTRNKRFIHIIIALAAVMTLSSCRSAASGELPDTTAQEATEAAAPVTAADAADAAADASGSGDKDEILVCVDPGHGFGDVGCTSDYLGCYEYEITMPLSLQLKEELEARGATVILTHDGNTYPDVTELAEKARAFGIDFKEDEIKDNDIFSAYERALYAQVLDREQNIDFFISLHVNSVENADYVSGYSLDYYSGNPYRAQLSELCRSLEEKLGGEMRIFEDSFEDAYKVTKYGDFPSLLFEVGYATNPEDAARLKDEEQCRRLAEITADAIISFIGGQA